MSTMGCPLRLWSENRILKPTCASGSGPQAVLSSCAMRRATLVAAIRRGWVWAMERPLAARPAARAILGSWVVFPEPVSPQTISTRCWTRACAISTQWALTGRLSSNTMARSAAARRSSSGLGHARSITTKLYCRDVAHSRAGSPAPIHCRTRVCVVAPVRRPLYPRLSQ